MTSGRVLLIVASAGVLGGMLILLASSTSLIIILIALFVGMLVVPYASAMSQSIWMSKVEPDVQGRVFSVRSMIAQITNPIALALVGPLADRVFVPLMEGDSTVARWFGAITGTGAGAGYAAFFVALGFAAIAVGIGAWSYGPLRNLERDLPDAEGVPSAAVAPGGSSGRDSSVDEPTTIERRGT